MATTNHANRPTVAHIASSERAAGGAPVPKPVTTKKKVPGANTGKTKEPTGKDKEGKADGPGTRPKPGTA